MRISTVASVTMFFLHASGLSMTMNTPAQPENRKSNFHTEDVEVRPSSSSIPQQTTKAIVSQLDNTSASKTEDIFAVRPGPPYWARHEEHTVRPGPPYWKRDSGDDATEGSKDSHVRPGPPYWKRTGEGRSIVDLPE
ncbi:hypothetical protein VNI00_015222 [Paramarasmius palmivorus]|uniref:Uncharacterized protein n=1 Tax=Paramarasmius palmivorus TaxID=297713 RepID=A0AAW0BNG6_9AGAR